MGDLGEATTAADFFLGVLEVIMVEEVVLEG